MLTITDINSVTKKIGIVYEEWMQPLCKATGLPFTAFAVLMYFANNPNQNTAHELCLHRGFKRAIVSVHIESLVQKGYLDRKTVEGDRRKFSLVPTKKAEPFVTQGRLYQKRFESAILEGLSKENLEIVEKCFDIIKDNVASMSK